MTKDSYLERYQAGEYICVWQELIDLGDKACQEPLYSEVLKICQEIIKRVRFNLYTLHTRLLELGYEFDKPALVDATPSNLVKIEKIEKELGTLPLIAKVWYSTFASVNFCQSSRQLYCGGVDRPLESPDIFGLGSHPTLLFQNLDNAQEEFLEMVAEHEKASENESNIAKEFHSFLPLGGYASNCAPKGFSLPEYGVDAVIYNDGGGDTYFVEELRGAFQWGGFPFWSRLILWKSKKKERFYVPLEYKPNFEKLFPILKQGLLEF